MASCPPGCTGLFPAMQQTLVTLPAPAFILFHCCFCQSDRFGRGLNLPKERVIDCMLV